jgi:hypothetical protein
MSDFSTLALAVVLWRRHPPTVAPGEGADGKQQAGGGGAGLGNATLTHDYTPSHDRGLACKAGDAVTVLRTDPEWARVRNNSSGQEGWVPQAFLKMDDASSVGGTEPSMPPPPGPQGGLGQGLVAAAESSAVNVTAL